MTDVLKGTLENTWGTAYNVRLDGITSAAKTYTTNDQKGKVITKKQAKRTDPCSIQDPVPESNIINFPFKRFSTYSI